MLHRHLVFVLFVAMALIVGCGESQEPTSISSQEPPGAGSQGPGSQEPTGGGSQDPTNGGGSGDSQGPVDSGPEPGQVGDGLVKITINDDTNYHVHASGKPFTVNVTVDYSGSSTIYYHWQDFRGRSLSEPVMLSPGNTIILQSPGSSVGYYGLVFRASNDTLVLPERQPGESREYGFTIFTPRTTSDRILNVASPFGMVHADIQDPYLPTWAKTATWKTFSPGYWKAAMDERRSVGVLELPLLLEDEWDADDNTPVTAEQLAVLETKIREYFSADPRVVYWELGLEENLQPRFRQAQYWANLEAKTRAVRQAADAVNPEIKLIYQIAELDMAPIQQFLQSKAASYYDILSLHPYAWPDFPSPENWMKALLQNTNDLIRQNNIQSMPIWFTEAGAPHHGNYPGAFFGYPATGDAVKGLSREESVNNMIKTHVLALHMGVEKVFWYNYQDQGKARNYAEDHFGIRDYWGYPKPVYVAYINLLMRLDGKSLIDARQLAGNIRVYQFKDGVEDVLVAWSYPDSVQMVPFASLQAGLTRTNVSAVVDAVGTPLTIEGETIRVTGEPVFIMIRAD